MANEKNLIPLSQRTPEEQRAIRAKGGKAKAAMIKESKTIAGAVRAILAEETPAGVTKLEAIAAATIAKLYKDGDIRDLKVLADLLGESVTTLKHEGLPQQIVVGDKQTAEELQAILNADHTDI